MTVFFIAVAVALVGSALCSLTEAALYAVSPSYVRQLSESGSSAGKALARFKGDMARPIAAVLIVNTAANTAGASIAGAQFRKTWPEVDLFWFAALFTLGILFLSEILPKVAGVAFNRGISHAVSVPLELVIGALSPMVWISQHLTRAISRRDMGPQASEEEVRHLAELSAEEGSILPEEKRWVHNILQLDTIKAQDVMSPRTMVVTASANDTVGDLAEKAAQWPNARIPICSPDDPENWIGLVLRRDVLVRLAGDRFDETLESFKKPIEFVPNTTPCHKLLTAFTAKRAHLFAVVDEYGTIVGIVTLEDVMESIIGAEIVDETDAVADLQAAARLRPQQISDDSQRRFENGS
jgi:CBS domain containing-hemolysin-like protein